MKTTRVLCVAALAILFCLSSWAQLSKGFRGKVLDRDGNPVAGIEVKFVDQSNPSNHYETKTDASGNFVYTGLPYSDKGYIVTVQLPGLPAVSKASMVKMMEITDLVFDMRKDIVVRQASKADPAQEAKNLFDMGDFEGAAAKADEAIKAGGENVKPALLIKATALARLDRVDDAIAAFEAYNKAYPGDVNVLGEMVKLYQKKGDKAKADEYKKEFVAKGGVLTGATYNSGVEALNKGDYEKAAGFFEKAIQEDPKDADSHRELARCLVQMGKYQETIDQLNIYLKMKPDASDAAVWKQAIAGLQTMMKSQNDQKK
jgi:tetratricopeptide (TPR) repeat protein